MVESPSEKRARKILEDTTVRTESGKFQTGLLWRYDLVEFPDSKPMAERRLQCLERRLSKDPTLYDKVREQIDDYLSKGYTHKATERELKETVQNQTWYLPLGVVVNPKKPEKVRVVWDAAATVKGVSLNSVLLKGPDLLQSLPTVLCRFRQREVAINADIKEMFHQVIIRPEDRQAQRFLWRNNPSEQTEVFVMDVAIFGATCSPSSAQFAKNRNAVELSREFPRAATAVLENHYVDDYLDSVDSVYEAVELAREVKTLHQYAGFELRHWLSNSVDVLEQIGEKPSETPKNFVMGKDVGTERVLGLSWLPQKDIFTFAIQFRENLKRLLDGNTYPTKREPLSLVMSIFDPLGLVANFVIHGKNLVQEVWRSGSTWDDNIPELLFASWSLWVRALHSLEQVRTQRCYFPGYDPEALETLELHVFVDATWLRADQRRFHQFVAFRVGEILESTDVNDWRKVPSKWNVSDEATKWGNGPDASEESRWLRGPSFLYQDEAEWPGHKEEEWSTAEELRNIITIHRCSVTGTVQFERFSKWERLGQAMGYVQRFLNNCLGKRNNLPCLTTNNLCSKELQEAEIMVLKLVQLEVYPQEFAVLEALQKDSSHHPKQIEKKSRIYKLDPFIGADGLIRKDGRIGAAPAVADDAKFPVKVPKDHYVTMLIIDGYHRKFAHANNETIVNELRQRFHVSEIRVAVGKVAKSCTLCKVRKAVPRPPRMSPLPEARLTPYIRAFTFTGLDYFGPVTVRVGRTNVKRWAALFTCLTTRAVHLEVAFTLSTESCKLAIRRFIARRGAPLEIYSDQGLNFQGARKELREEIRKLNQELASTFTNAATQWKMNPPYAPHMGESEALTPNHFLMLLSSNGVCQPIANPVEVKSTLCANWNLVRVMLDRFWTRWATEYLPAIARQSKWFGETKPVRVGDLLIEVDEAGRISWERAVVVKVNLRKDGRIRSADVKSKAGIFLRPVTKLTVLDVLDEDCMAEDRTSSNTGSECRNDSRPRHRLKPFSSSLKSTGRMIN
ncbi:uncharacterized protein LOC134208999 [Armigeres subalbatus]|uniref:uncharacterized protein LOC134208999 n=1 Tax=Armigeres subalbatus TaxID=124917 RepID=UPI002ED06684